MKVLHLVPSYASHDAIGTHTRLLHEALQRQGIDSTIVADEGPGTSGFVPFAKVLRRPIPRSWVLWYQASTTSRMASWFAAHERNPRLLTYHNVTPWVYAETTSIETARAMFRARAEIAALASKGLATTPSRFNARDLVRLGFRDVRVIPPLIALPSTAPPRPPRPHGSRWLFIGRLVPHKRQDRLIAALAAYRASVDADATLTLVGKATEPRWAEALVGLAHRLGLAHAVHFAGELDEQALERAWAEASVYVAASDHEGFGFPLLEAIAAGLPVVALARGAVAETLGQAGILVSDGEPRALAEAVAIVEHEPRLRRELMAEGARLLGSLDPHVVALQYRAALWEALT
jgi:glycosyltransferase involved in cell wall biosynthesis